MAELPPTASTPEARAAAMDALRAQRAAGAEQLRKQREEAVRQRAASPGARAAPQALGSYVGPSWEEAGLKVPDLVKDALPDGLPTRPYKREVIDDQGVKTLQDAYGIDVRKTANAVAEARLQRRVAEWTAQNPGTPVTKEQRSAWTDVELKAADQILRKAIATANNVSVAFIDDDPTSRTRDLVKAAENPLLKPFVPIAAWLSPYSYDVYEPKEKNAEITAVPQQYGGWDWLHWLAQGAPSTYVATAARHGLGTEDQIKAIREGESLFDPYYLEKMGGVNPLFVAAKGGGFVDDGNEKFFQTLAGLPIGLGIAVLEPDAITAALFGVGKFAKIGKAGKASMAALDAARKGQEAARELRAVEASVDAAQEARAAGQGASGVLEASKAARERVLAEGLPGAPVGDVLRAKGSAEGMDASAKAAHLLKAADRVDAMQDAGALGSDAREAALAVAGVQRSLSSLSPSLAKGVEWMLQAQLGTTIPASGTTMKVLDGVRYTKDKVFKALESAGIVDPAMLDGIKVLSMPIKELRAYAYDKGVLAARSLPREQILDKLGLAAQLRRGQYAHQHIPDAAKAAQVAELELRARHGIILASEAVIHDLRAYHELVKVMGAGRKSSAAPAVAQAVADEAAQAFQVMSAARKALFSSGKAEDITKAEAVFERAQVRFAAAMQRAAEQLGANAPAVLERSIEQAADELVTALNDVKGLRAALENSKAPELQAIVPGMDRALSAAMESVRTAATYEARGSMVLRAYASTLRAVGNSYTRLGEVLEVGGHAKVPEAQELLRVLVPLTEGRVTGTAVLNGLRSVLPDEVLTALAGRGDGVAGVLIRAAESAGDAGTLVLDGHEATKVAAELAQFAKNFQPERAGTSIAEALNLHERMIQYGSPGVMQRGLAQIGSWFKGLGTPAARLLGPSSEDVLQIGKGMLDAQRLMQKEVLEIVSTATGREGRIAALDKYLTDPTATFTFGTLGGTLTRGRSIINSATGHSLWDEATTTIRAMDAAGVLAGRGGAETIIQGLSRMWLPSGAEARSKVGALYETALNIIRYAEPNAPKTESAQILGKLAATRMPFSEFSRMMREATADIVGGGAPEFSAAAILEAEGVRATAFAAQLVSQAALLHRARRAMTAKTVGLEPDVLKAAEAITGGVPGKAGENWEKAMGVFAALQIPPKLGQQAVHGGRDLFHGLSALTDEMGGSASILPTRWIDAMAENMGSVVKSAEEYSAKAANPESMWHAQTVGAVAQLWKTGLTTGVLFPRPRYFANMIVGNFSQVWVEPGVWAAMRNTSQVLTNWSAQSLANIPGIGTKIDELYARSLGGGAPGSRLASMSNALFNPYVTAVYDPKLLPATQKIRTASGATITGAELRGGLVQQGILTTYASTSLSEHMSRLANAPISGAAPGTLAHQAQLYALRAAKRPVVEGVLRPLQRLSSHWADLADWAEQRQRVALFTDLVVRKGYDFEKAGKITRDALYDWGAIAVSGELGFLQRMVMFYRFWRLALQQGVRTLLDPLVRSGEGVGGLMKVPGSAVKPYKTRYVRNMTNLTEGMRAVSAAGEGPDADEDGQVSEAEAKLWEYRQLYPWWVSKSSRLGGRNSPMTAEESAWHLMNFGDTATYEATTYPAFTPMDTTSLLLSAAATLAFAASGNMSVEESVRAGSEIAGGFMSEPIAEALQGMTEYFLQDKDRYATKGDLLKRPTERLIFKSLDGLTYQYQGDNPDTGGALRARPFWSRLYRLTPVLGTDIGYWLDPLLMDPVDRKGIVEGTTWVIRQWTGLGMSAYHDPEKSLQRAGAYGIPGDVKRASKEARKYDAPNVQALGPSPQDVPVAPAPARR